MLSAVQQADGKFQLQLMRNKLDLSPEQKARIRDESPPSDSSPSAEPSFWVHFDKEVEEIRILQSRPADDDDSSSELSLFEMADAESGILEEDSKSSAALGDKLSSAGAADNAF